MCIFWKCGFFDFDPFWTSIWEHFGSIWKRFGASGRPLGSQNGTKSGPGGTQNEVQNEVWKLKGNFDENDPLDRAPKGFLGTWFEKEREAR